jgi:hypothetical protein
VAVLSANKLLSVWERALVQRPAERAHTLLDAASDDASREDIAQLSIGQREARLLDFREQTFGGTFNVIASCPGCDERLELNFTASDVRVESENQTPSTLAIERDGYVVTFRLPQSLDLAALHPDADTEENRRHLLDRCVITAERAGRKISGAELPDEIVSAIAAKMAEADPLANIEVALNCPACSHSWHAPLDVALFLWTELNAWAIRLLRDVHALACAYGWTEADILALSPTRRRLYLEMIIE